ncbi:MAG TPA: NAD(P)H-dependent oxidoreductase [Gaiellales bacterium]|jgi:NAD(P)H-dependent FMN reductase
MPNLLVVIASTRPGRIGLPVGEWFVDAAREHGAFDVSVADLAEWNLPFLDEPNHPRLHEYVHDHTRRWSETVDAADAFVFVMPEYNHGINAPLKNAIDYLHEEWSRKPVGFVSYGGVAAGTRAVQMTKQIVVSLRMVPVNDAVSIPFVKAMMGDDGVFHPSETVERSAGPMLDELAAVAQALRSVRHATQAA